MKRTRRFRSIAVFAREHLAGSLTLTRPRTGMRLARFLAVLALGGLPPLSASAQATTNTLVTGSWTQTGPQGYDERATFTCRGTPTCVGQLNVSTRLENCSNYHDQTADITFTNLNLSQSGSIQGSVTFRGGNIDAVVVRLPNGTCNFPNPPVFTETFPLTAVWNAATGSGTFTIVLPFDPISGTLAADLNAAPPVFPMVVSSSIDQSTATASADIQYRPQDVGTTGSVYVFAVAPSSRIAGGLAAKAVVAGSAQPTGKAGEKAEACVIAQLSPAGQLVAVTGAQMQAFLSGTLSAQGASVTILNGTPTPAVAGATFYVGYGPSGSTMLSSGVFRNAVLVPGSSVCPMLPSQTALWWNPAESGWGLNLNHQGSILFGTLFTYDAGRAPLWLVMSNGALQSDGLTYTGDLYRTTGPAFNANPFTPIGTANLNKVGTMTVSFAEANSGTVQYTVDGAAVRKYIQRQVFGTRASNCMPSTESRASSSNFQDLWWNASESGWGLNVTHQDNTLFATLFTYDATGRNLWLVMSAGQRQADGSYLGDLYRTAGPPFNAIPFTPIGSGDVTTVGTMRLRFSDGNNGTLTYTYSGATVTKAITRQVFSSPLPACN